MSRGLEDFLRVARRVREIAVRYDRDARVYLFGSAAAGRMTGISDIDILVISEKPEYEYKVKVEAYMSIEAPIQIHYITEEQYRRWYSRFIEKSIPVE